MSVKNIFVIGNYEKIKEKIAKNSNWHPLGLNTCKVIYKAIEEEPQEIYYWNISSETNIPTEVVDSFLAKTHHIIYLENSENFEQNYLYWDKFLNEKNVALPVERLRI